MFIVGQMLEGMDDVVCYVKHQDFVFFIAYTINGDQRNYVPDFIVRLDDRHGHENVLNLIVEVSGKRDRKKEAEVSTARTLWVPAVSNAGKWGRWSNLEISTPWDAQTTIKAFITRSASIAD